MLNYTGRRKEAITDYKKAIHLNLNHPKWYLANMAIACRDAGCYGEAIPTCRKILQKEPGFIFTYTLLASSYDQMGRLEEARAEAAEVLRIDPKFSAGYICRKLSYKYEEDRKRFRDSLLKAGLPD